MDYSTGNAVVWYTYDAWGNVLSVGGSLANTLGKLNPFRYRSYVYDEESKLYYLQSRYYDPEMGRFINADALPSTGQGLLGNNMFAYCGNNPVNREDIEGELWSAIAGGAIAGAIIGAVSHVASSGINGEHFSTSGILSAALTGAVTGAIGAAAGVVEGMKVAYSFTVGVISGAVTAYSANGTLLERFVAGATAGIVSGVGTYLSTNIPTLTEDGVLIEAITAFSGTLFGGTQTEIVNVSSQKGVSTLFGMYASVN